MKGKTVKRRRWQERVREARDSWPIPSLLEEQTALPCWGQASSSWFLGFSHRSPPTCELCTNIYIRD